MLRARRVEMCYVVIDCDVQFQNSFAVLMC